MEKRNQSELKFYITTAIDYVNSVPHIGHALEKVQADAIARYKRLAGLRVKFTTGTDEHGIKNMRAAESAGMTTQNFVDQNSDVFKRLARELNISNDYFVRTSDRDNHWPAAVKLWKKLVASGDIYKKEYEGLYCVGHEAFMTAKDLVDGLCPIHKKAPETIKEENYFFRLSKYADTIQKIITENELVIVPEASRNEVLHLLTEGLRDVSFSRRKESLPWGIPVPGDAEQTIYVWADALPCYISALGYGKQGDDDAPDFRAWWPADMHVVGKDIVRFHALIWPAMLISAGLALPRTLFVHGFISVGGEKMSKSVGNVIDPFPLIAKYGADAVRYYLLREIPPTQDGDFTYDKFHERYQGDLQRGLGNFVSRIVALGARAAKEIKPVRGDELDKIIDDVWKNYHAAMEKYIFGEALAQVWALIAYGDKEIDRTKPWALSLEQGGPASPTSQGGLLGEHLGQMGVILATVAHMLRPFLPATAERIFEEIGVDPESDKEWRFSFKKKEPLFPGVDNN